MRTPDPRHEQQIQEIAPLSAEQLIQRIHVRDHTDPRHLHSEVLATLLRHPVDSFAKLGHFETHSR